MDKPRGIIVFGANGSGKTTLGRELARILTFKHMDREEYYFEKSEIPYIVVSLENSPKISKDFFRHARKKAQE